MTDNITKTLTKAQFLEDMRKGWIELNYGKGEYWAGPGFSSRTRRVYDRKDVECACAIGAAAYGAGCEGFYEYVEKLPRKFLMRITSVSDSFGGADYPYADQTRKELAMKQVEKVVMESDWDEEYIA